MQKTIIINCRENKIRVKHAIQFSIVIYEYDWIGNKY